MEILTNLRTRLHQQLLKKELPNFQMKRSSVFLDNAASIGLLFDATELEERLTVIGFAEKLKSLGKNVNLLGFFNTKLKTNDFPFHFFDKKQLDWALRPNKAVLANFVDQPFDLLINLSNRNVAPLNYIAAHSKARFRVGPYTQNTICYDLMIEHDKNKGLEAFLKLVLHYLERMQPTRKAAVV